MESTIADTTAATPSQRVDLANLRTALDIAQEMATTKELDLSSSERIDLALHVYNKLYDKDMSKLEFLTEMLNIVQDASTRK